ncbi:uncharacterized protein LOC143430670 [Xylocopa sonorina]|uniref:uncharacterized protein LOC143430670 n=1 Tax=Xylocopa sonorina TaxID=1818115 RepID=UPI00403AA80A
MCYIEAKLKIIVKMGFETQIVKLIGRGIEKRVNIIAPVIRFLPTVPFTEIQDKVFTIENACDYPMELFWHHLDDTFQTEDHIAKALLYYYKAKEILLPLRKPGEPMAWQLTKFYNDLLNEMSRALAMEKLDKQKLLEEDVVSELKTPELDVGKRRERRRVKSGTKRKSRKHTARSTQQSTSRRSSHRRTSRRGKKSEVPSDTSSTDSDKKDCPDFSIFGENSIEYFPLPTSDPEQIQQLLFCYIDSLHEAAGFQSRMKDPVKELFASIQRKSVASNDLPGPSKPLKRACVIFHGAPFTEYQEAACRSAKVLQLPVLRIDEAITEVIAFGGSACSIQMRLIIDDTYESYLEAYEKQIHRLAVEDARETDETESTRGSRGKRKGSPRDKSSRTADSPKGRRKTRTSKSTETEAPATREEVILRLRADPDPLTELGKIPAPEKLETLDSLSRYEYKIQAILLLERIVDARAIHESPGDKADRSARMKQETTFLGISPALIAEALRERLSAEDLERGFVVQSLQSNFLRNNAHEVLLSLLRIVGHIEYLQFVVFLNSMACYHSKVEQLRREIGKRRERLISTRGSRTSTRCRCLSTISFPTRIRRCI